MSAKKKRLSRSVEPHNALLCGDVRQPVVADVPGQKPAGARICLQREHPPFCCKAGERQCRDADIGADVETNCIGFDDFFEYFEHMITVAAVPHRLDIVAIAANRKPAAQNSKLSTYRVVWHSAGSSLHELRFSAVDASRVEVPRPPIGSEPAGCFTFLPARSQPCNGAVGSIRGLFSRRPPAVGPRQKGSGR
jgi:hypothetical protein